MKVYQITQHKYPPILHMYSSQRKLMIVNLEIFKKISVNYKRLKDVLLFVVFTKVRERDLFDLMSDRITS